MKLISQIPFTGLPDGRLHRITGIFKMQGKAYFTFFRTQVLYHFKGYNILAGHGMNNFSQDFKNLVFAEMHGIIILNFN
jgi:hypothetical protein